MLAGLFLFALVFFMLCYRYYGRFLKKAFGVNESNQTPAQCRFDGMDYCPTHPVILMGHHFASIAGAGPVVGPITAAAWFGWLPAYLWCLIGSAFFGGPHDLGSLMASIRHEGGSIGLVVKRWIGLKGFALFMCFSIMTLVLIVAVFLEFAANTLAAYPIVAFAAAIYMLAALAFGFLTYRFGLSFKWVTVAALALVFGATAWGYDNKALEDFFSLGVGSWRWILAAYAFLASVLPVWMLLQPRDYLVSFFLYFAVIVGAIGMLCGSFIQEPLTVKLPAFLAFSKQNPNGSQYMWPILFVTVACGAISGFHALVGSGTTAKQLRSERDSLPIAYGGMLLEGMVAVIAIGAVMIVGAMSEGGPVATYAEGFGRFAAIIGLDPKLGASMGALAINSFILTSLDTATRLARYQIQEFSSNGIGPVVATVAIIVWAMSLIIVRPGDKPTSDLIWPVFGSANQLVAGLTLMTLIIWLGKQYKKTARFLLFPMWFMLATTISALTMLLKEQLSAAYPNYVLILVAGLLLILSLAMIWGSFKSIQKGVQY